MKQQDLRCLLATVTFEPIRWINRLQPAKATRWLIEGALRLISRFVLHLPERCQPFSLSEMQHRTYPQGYRTEELGPLMEKRTISRQQKGCREVLTDSDVINIELLALDTTIEEVRSLKLTFPAQRLCFWQFVYSIKSSVKLIQS